MRPICGLNPNPRLLTLTLTLAQLIPNMVVAPWTSFLERPPNGYYIALSHPIRQRRGLLHGQSSNHNQLKSESSSKELSKVAVLSSLSMLADRRHRSSGRKRNSHRVKLCIQEKGSSTLAERAHGRRGSSVPQVGMWANSISSAQS
jgi:hypothetical protein